MMSRSDRGLTTTLQIAAGDAVGHAGHRPSCRDHPVERVAKDADFVFARRGVAGMSDVIASREPVGDAHDMSGGRP